MVDCHEILLQHYLSIKEQNQVGDFLYHEYFSCDKRDPILIGSANYSILKLNGSIKR